MATKQEIIARLRQSIAKKNAWLSRSNDELSRIYAERHGVGVALS